MRNNLKNYDPFTYNPGLRFYFGTGPSGSFGGGDEDTVAKVAAENPGAAGHVNSVWSFMNWMQQSNPEYYDAISGNRPDLVNAAEVVTSGKLGMQMSGMGEVMTDGTAEPATGWGQDVLDFFKQAVPAYYQNRAQSDLIKLNISRAERGLPPIDASGVAPQVNVGMSAGMTKLAYVAVGGLVLVGLLSVIKSRK